MVGEKGRKCCWAEVVLLEEYLLMWHEYFNVFLENLHCCTCSKPSTKLYNCFSTESQKVVAKNFGPSYALLCFWFFFLNRISCIVISTSIIIVHQLFYNCVFVSLTEVIFTQDIYIHFYFSVMHYVSRNKLNILLQV